MFFKIYVWRNNDRPFKKRISNSNIDCNRWILVYNLWWQYSFLLCSGGAGMYLNGNLSNSVLRFSKASLSNTLLKRFFKNIFSASSLHSWLALNCSCFFYLLLSLNCFCILTVIFIFLLLIFFIDPACINCF